MKRLLTVLLFLAIPLVHSNSQTFSGFNAFKKIIEYEGQRFLMDEVFQITTSEIDKLRIDKTISEIDSDEGFMFVLTSYDFNEKQGVIITSFSSTNFTNNSFLFRNVHLTKSEFENLNNRFINLHKALPSNKEHFLQRFNDQLIIDVNKEAESINYVLWVDNYSRHTFSDEKWGRAIKRFRKFAAK